MSQTPLVFLSRGASFCAGLRLYNDRWSSERNREIYGIKTGAHGAEFQLNIALSGRISDEDGMIVNLSEVKPHVKEVAQSLDNKFLDKDIAFFKSNRPTAENIASYCWTKLPQRIGNGDLHRLLLKQENRINVEILQNSMKVSYTYEFAAAHRLYTPDLSDQENWNRFDKCSNPSGHGHNFQLHVWIEGIPDSESGFIISPRLLDEIVEEEIYQRFDHKHLNEDCPEFADGKTVPTTENLALIIFRILGARLQTEGYNLVRIGLQETQKNYFEVGV